MALVKSTYKVYTEEDKPPETIPGQIASDIRTSASDRIDKLKEKLKSFRSKLSLGHFLGSLAPKPSGNLHKELNYYYYPHRTEDGKRDGLVMIIGLENVARRLGLLHLLKSSKASSGIATQLVVALKFDTIPQISTSVRQPVKFFISSILRTGATFANKPIAVGYEKEVVLHGGKGVVTWECFLDNVPPSVESVAIDTHSFKNGKFIVQHLSGRKVPLIYEISVAPGAGSGGTDIIQLKEYNHATDTTGGVKYNFSPDELSNKISKGEFSEPKSVKELFKDTSKAKKPQKYHGYPCMYSKQEASDLLRETVEKQFSNAVMQGFYKFNDKYNTTLYPPSTAAYMYPKAHKLDMYGSHSNIGIYALSCVKEILDHLHLKKAMPRISDFLNGVR